MSYSHCFTSFTVMKNYKEFKDEKGFIRWIVNLEPEHKLDAKFKEQKVYNPLEEAKELYTELYKVNFKDTKTLTKFVSTYGLPIGENIEEGNKEIKAFYKMDVLKFIEKFLDYIKIFNLWKAIQDNDVKKLEAAKKKISLFSAKDIIQMSDEYKMYVLESNVEINDFFNAKGPFSNEEFKLWMSVKDGDLKDIARAYITVLLNKESFGQIKTTIDDVPCNEGQKVVMKKKIVEAISFNNLFEEAFYQLRQAIFNEMRVRTCEHCGFPFEVTHERQRFCPTRLGTKRSSCENTYNQRIKRQRKKEKDKILTE